MAAPNQPYRENWFSRLLDRKGSDYIETGKLTDAEVLRNIDRIIDDIINGRIDYSVYGKCIMAPVVFDNLLSYCRSRLSSEMSKMYCISFTNWSIDNGIVTVANTNHMINSTNSYVPGVVPSMFDYDMSAWCNGHCTITPTMRNDISTALREVTIEYNKFLKLTEIFEKVQLSKNVYDIQLATNVLKQFIRSNNKVIY